MLRISRLTDYGTVIMSQMARHPERIFSSSELALVLGLGAPTVGKVLRGLARHGLVIGIRGLHGGYTLARAPTQISVADIVDALEEQPFGLTECSAGDGLCDLEESCGIRTGWRKINDIVRRALESTTVASMVQATVPLAGRTAPVGLPVGTPVGVGRPRRRRGTPPEHGAEFRTRKT